jgi:TubC N-terminal docking domain
MTVPEILAQCATLGVTLAPGDAGTLRVSPPGVLPDGLRAELQAHKTALLRLLSAPPADVLNDERCPTCGSRERWLWLDGRLLCRLCLLLDLVPLTLRPVGSQEPKQC